MTIAYWRFEYRACADKEFPAGVNHVKQTLGTAHYLSAGMGGGGVIWISMWLVGGGGGVTFNLGFQAGGGVMFKLFQ